MPFVAFVGFERVLAFGIIIAVLTLAASGLLFYVFEHGRNERVVDIGSGFLWVTRTLLEQATPWDITTAAGNAVYYIVLIAGVSLAAMVTAAIASKLIELVLRRSRGLGEAHLHGHIVICGWNSKGPEILRELHAEEVEDKRYVVILAPLESHPSRDKLTTFIRGNPHNGEDLVRAGIQHADTAIVLADDSNPHQEADDIDAKTLLATLAIESINPSCHTCVEVLRSENRQHFARAKTDEMVVSSELTGALLASAAITHGISWVVGDLMTHPAGNEFYAMAAPPEVSGLTVAAAMPELKRLHDCILVAIADGEDSYTVNPPGDRTLREGDRLLVISRRAPAGSTGPAHILRRATGAPA